MLLLQSLDDIAAAREMDSIAQFTIDPYPDSITVMGNWAKIDSSDYGKIFIGEDESSRDVQSIALFGTQEMYPEEIRAHRSESSNFVNVQGRFYEFNPSIYVCYAFEIKMERVPDKVEWEGIGAFTMAYNSLTPFASEYNQSSFTLYPYYERYYESQNVYLKATLLSLGKNKYNLVITVVDKDGNTHWRVFDYIYDVKDDWTFQSDIQDGGVVGLITEDDFKKNDNAIVNREGIVSDIQLITVRSTGERLPETTGAYGDRNQRGVYIDYFAFDSDYLNGMTFFRQDDMGSLKNLSVDQTNNIKSVIALRQDVRKGRTDMTKMYSKVKNIPVSISFLVYLRAGLSQVKLNELIRSFEINKKLGRVEDITYFTNFVESIVLTNFVGSIVLGYKEKLDTEIGFSTDFKSIKVTLEGSIKWEYESNYTGQSVQNVKGTLTVDRGSEAIITQYYKEIIDAFYKDIVQEWEINVLEAVILEIEEWDLYNSDTSRKVMDKVSTDFNTEVYKKIKNLLDQLTFYSAYVFWQPELSSTGVSSVTSAYGGNPEYLEGLGLYVFSGVTPSLPTGLVSSMESERMLEIKKIIGTASTSGVLHPPQTFYGKTEKNDTFEYTVTVHPWTDGSTQLKKSGGIVLLLGEDEVTESRAEQTTTITKESLVQSLAEKEGTLQIDQEKYNDLTTQYKEAVTDIEQMRASGASAKDRLEQQKKINSIYDEGVALGVEMADLKAQIASLKAQIASMN